MKDLRCTMNLEKALITFLTSAFALIMFATNINGSLLMVCGLILSIIWVLFSAFECYIDLLLYIKRVRLKKEREEELNTEE